MSVKYEKNIEEPYYTLINDGKKKIEGRLFKDDFLKMKKDDIIKFKNQNSTFEVKIVKIKIYENFKEMLEEETLEKVAPNLESIEEALNVYYNFFSEEDRNKYKTCAIHIEKI